MRALIAASGSEGNAVVLEADGARVMLDAGIGLRALEQRLDEAGFGGMPDAIVVTHAHHDHYGRAPRLARKLDVPLFVTPATARDRRLEGCPRARTFHPRAPFEIGPFTIAPIPVPHDAAQVALTVTAGRFRCSMATDLGVATPALLDHVAGSDLLLVEANHDELMLADGPYPPHLKARVRSARGHLSNVETARFLRSFVERNLPHTIVLLHLSKTNNTPELALGAARKALAGHKAHLRAAIEPLVVDASSKLPPDSFPIVATERRRSSRTGALPGQLPLFAARAG